MRRSFAALARTVKATTGIAGLPVVPNSKEVLQYLVDKMLKDVQILDEGVFYRKYVTSTYTRMKKILEANDDIGAIEDYLGYGYAEEAIEKIKKHLRLIPRLAYVRPWEMEVPDVDDEDFQDTMDQGMISVMEEENLDRFYGMTPEDLRNAGEKYPNREEFTEHLRRLHLERMAREEAGKGEVAGGGGRQ